MTLYRTLDVTALTTWLAAHPALATRLGGQAGDWTVREVSDGNLNNVFIVEGPAGDGAPGAVCCKQSLPHVRVDPTWKMPLTRTDFEARYMRVVTPHVGHLIPEMLAFDADLHLLAMEALVGHRVLRGALADGTAQAGFSARIGEYVGRAGFFTSWRGRPFEAAMGDLAAFAGNTALTRITVDLVLTDPYRPGCTRNHWASPALDTTVGALQTDDTLRAAISRLQERFLGAPQALLHGDLHTGSIMVRGDDVRVIDGEFALMGPIGFDAGLFLGNLLLHAAARPDRAGWMLDEIELFWRVFTRTWCDLWDAHPHAGDVGALLSAGERHRAQAEALKAVVSDAAGFAGAEIIRRTIGYAQVADFALAGDAAEQHEARERALALGRRLVVKGSRILTIDAFLEAVA